MRKALSMCMKKPGIAAGLFGSNRANIRKPENERLIARSMRQRRGAVGQRAQIGNHVLDIPACETGIEPRIAPTVKGIVWIAMIAGELAAQVS